jgi:hypothetical protein
LATFRGTWSGGTLSSNTAPSKNAAILSRYQPPRTSGGGASQQTVHASVSPNLQNSTGQAPPPQTSTKSPNVPAGFFTNRTVQQQEALKASYTGVGQYTQQGMSVQAANLLQPQGFPTISSIETKNGATYVNTLESTPMTSSGQTTNKYYAPSYFGRAESVRIAQRQSEIKQKQAQLEAQPVSTVLTSGFDQPKNGYATNFANTVIESLRTDNPDLIAQKGRYAQWLGYEGAYVVGQVFDVPYGFIRHPVDTAMNMGQGFIQSFTSPQASTASSLNRAGYDPISSSSQFVVPFLYFEGAGQGISYGASKISPYLFRAPETPQNNPAPVLLPGEKSQPSSQTYLKQYPDEFRGVLKETPEGAIIARVSSPEGGKTIIDMTNIELPKKTFRQTIAPDISELNMNIEWNKRISAADRRSSEMQGGYNDLLNPNDIVKNLNEMNKAQNKIKVNEQVIQNKRVQRAGYQESSSDNLINNFDNIQKGLLNQNEQVVAKNIKGKSLKDQFDYYYGKKGQDQLIPQWLQVDTTSAPRSPAPPESAQVLKEPEILNTFRPGITGTSIVLSGLSIPTTSTTTKVNIIANPGLTPSGMIFSGVISGAIGKQAQSSIQQQSQTPVQKPQNIPWQGIYSGQSIIQNVTNVTAITTGALGGTWLADQFVNPPTPETVLGGGGGGGSQNSPFSDYVARRGRSPRYMPSLTAVLGGFKSRNGQSLTGSGFELRPMIDLSSGILGGKRHKRKSRARRAPVKRLRRGGRK